MAYSPKYAVFLDARRKGYPIAAAARAAGLTKQAVHRRFEKDPSFRVADNLALDECAAKAAANLLDKAGKGDWRASLAVLERTWQDRWAPPAQQVESRVEAVVEQKPVMQPDGSVWQDGRYWRFDREAGAWREMHPSWTPPNATA